MLTSNTPFTIIANRARKLIDEIERKIQAEEIDTTLTFLDEIITAVSEFTRSLSEPSMVVSRMGKDELLVREYLTEPFTQAEEDLQLAFDQTVFLRELTRQLFNICQAERAGLGENISEVTSLTDQLRLWVSDSDTSFAWVGDTFNNRSNVDPASTVALDEKTGVTSLNLISSISLIDKIVSASIDRKLSAGGIPGNSLEIQEPGQEAFTGETPEPRPILFGDVRPRKDSLVAIFDGNPDTWFEWERNHIDPTQAVIKAGESFVFDPAGKTTYKTSKKRFLGIKIGTKNHGLQVPQLDNWTTFIRWPGDNTLDTGKGHSGYPIAYFQETDVVDLVLAVDLVLDQPRTVSWITLTPLIKGTAYPEVTQILVSPDGSSWANILSSPTVLHPRMNRGIDFSEYGNSASNFEGRGVWFTPSTAIKHIKIVLKQTKLYTPDLGFGHKFYMTSKRKRTKGPIQVVGSFTSLVKEGDEVDFSETEVQTQLSSLGGYDIFRGQRKVIAIRDLDLQTRSYTAEGQLISRPFVLERDSQTVALFTAERIPEDWDSARPDGNPWIAYEVSSDGQVWLPIKPQTAEILDSIVKFDAPTRRVYFRANFARPEDRPTESPVLLAYALKLGV